jgi:hypothetical protein
MVCGFLPKKRRRRKKTQVAPYCPISFYSNIPHPFSPTWPHCPHTLPHIPFWTKATLFYNNFIIQLPTAPKSPIKIKF